MSVEFNDTTCINPHQAIIDLANSFISKANELNGKLCSVEEGSIDRDNVLTDSLGELVSAVAALQAATSASPEDLEALRVLIVENQDALDGLSAQAALNRSIADQNTALTEANQTLVSQLNQAQQDATQARQAIQDSITNLTARVGVNEESVTQLDTRVTDLENRPVGTGEGITQAELDAGLCSVYTNIANSMAQAAASINNSAIAACTHGKEFTGPDTSSITGSVSSDDSSGAPV